MPITEADSQSDIIAPSPEVSSGDPDMSVSQGDIELGIEDLQIGLPSDLSPKMGFKITGFDSVNQGDLELGIDDLQIGPPSDLSPEMGFKITGFDVKFSQEALEAGQVQFVSDGSSKAPTWGVNYYPPKPPILTNNQLTIIGQQPVTFTLENLDADASYEIDHESRKEILPDLLEFRISDIQDGYFLPDQSIKEHYLYDRSVYSYVKVSYRVVMQGALQFVPTGPSPSYMASVCDGPICSPRHNAIIESLPAPESAMTSGFSNGAIAGMAGLLGLGLFALKAYGYRQRMAAYVPPGPAVVAAPKGA